MEIRYEEVSRPSAPHGNAPSFSEGVEMGFWRDPEPAEPYIALQPYIEDPEGRARTTPSGKIELYSERLATIRDTWTFHNGDRDAVRPVPSYFEIEGAEDGTTSTRSCSPPEGEEPVPQPLPGHRGAPAGPAGTACGSTRSMQSRAASRTATCSSCATTAAPCGSWRA